MKNLSFIGFDQYAITKDGKVFSIRAERFMSLKENPNGYIGVNLSKEGKKFRFLVHRLVAMAFIPNPEKKKTVNHIDGDKANNVLSNLEWATHSEQILHAIDTGLRPNQNFRWDRKLSDETVHRICQYLEDGFQTIEIARILGTERHVVKNIKSGTQYKDIVSEYDVEKITRKTGRVSTNKVDRIFDLLGKNTPRADVCKALNISEEILENILTGKVMSKFTKFRR